MVASRYIKCWQLFPTLSFFSKFESTDCFRYDLLRLVHFFLASSDYYLVVHSMAEGEERSLSVQFRHLFDLEFSSLLLVQHPAASVLDVNLEHAKVVDLDRYPVLVLVCLPE